MIISAPGHLDSWFDGRARLVATPRFTDARGALLPLDFSALPFLPRRLFVVHEVPAWTTRGRHSHKSSRQLLVRLAGTINVEMRANGASARHVLDVSERSLLLEPGVWAAQTYLTDDACLLVLASEPYRPDSYSNVETN